MRMAEVAYQFSFQVAHEVSGSLLVFFEILSKRATRILWSSGIAAGATHNQLELLHQTPILPVQISNITCYIFLTHHCIAFGKRNITCYIQCYATLYN